MREGGGHLLKPSFPNPSLFLSQGGPSLSIQRELCDESVISTILRQLCAQTSSRRISVAVCHLLCAEQ